MIPLWANQIHFIQKSDIVLDICFCYPKDRPKPYLALAITLLIPCSGWLSRKQIGPVGITCTVVWWLDYLLVDRSRNPPTWGLQMVCNTESPEKLFLESVLGRRALGMYWMNHLSIIELLQPIGSRNMTYPKPVGRRKSIKNPQCCC